MIKILNSSQVREWDYYTMNHEPIASIDLMERASIKVVDAILNHFEYQYFTIFCGIGNNGGDGLAIARILLGKQKNVTVYQMMGNQYSHDCKINRQRLLEIHDIIDINEQTEISINKEHCVIDAILGTGINRPVSGLTGKIIEQINALRLPVISIDLPSGMYADQSSKGNIMIRAIHVLTFQSYKACFFLPENADILGTVQVIDIGLKKEFLENVQTDLKLLEVHDIQKLIRKRKPFSHKGNYGKAILIGGSTGMLGALILSLKACLRAGAGKVYGVVDSEHFHVIHQSIPEALVISHTQSLSLIKDFSTEKLWAVGVGPGLGMGQNNQQLLYHILTLKNPMVLDADALNIIAENKWQHLIPEGSIITPHFSEFARLFGESENDMARIHSCRSHAKEFKIIIVLKGRFSVIALPDGHLYINPTGNPGMAKGGSGDVLTGMITSFLAQGMSQRDASFLGVYIHGLSADLAIKETSEYGLLASDIIEKIGIAFLQLTQETC